MNWEYVAGFFDGEGTIVFKDKASDGYTHTQLSFTNTNREVLQAIQDFTGCGRIYQASKRHAFGQYRTKPCYRLLIYRWREILKTARAIEPFTIVKKSNIRETIRLIQGKKWYNQGLDNVEPGSILKLYVQEHKGLDKIARLHGVHTRLVRSLLVKNGVTIRAPPTHLRRHPNV